MNKASKKASKKLRILNNRVDAFVSSRVELALKANHPVQCKRGCVGCCYMLVSATFLEVVEAVRTATKNGAFEKLILKMDQLHEDVKAISSPGMTTGVWLDERRPCFFLDVDSGDCLVYESRPYACRVYCVISEPAKCFAAASTTVLALDSSGSKAYRMWAPHYEEISNEHGFPDVYGPMVYLLPLAMLWVDGKQAQAVEYLRRAGAFDMLSWFRRWAQLELGA